MTSMTAQRTHAEDSMTTAPFAPDPHWQAQAKYTLEDLILLPDTAPRKIEILDGVMHVPPTASMGHQNLGRRLANWLEENAPSSGYEVTTDVGIVVDNRSTLEPDVVVLRAPATREHHYFMPDDVILAVEVVSPSTRRRDRTVKPALYAAAGVRYYWRVEQEPLHLHAYRLSSDEKTYEALADSDTLLVVEEPFSISLEVAHLLR